MNSYKKKLHPKDVQVVILAGGAGTRLKPITEKLTKVMIGVSGKPFLDHQFNYLKKAGFRRFLLLISYLGNQIEDYFKDGERFGIEISYSYEREPCGTGGALKLAIAKLEDRFVLINGDTFYPLDYNDFLSNAAQIETGGMIAAYDNHDKIATNNLKVEIDNNISKYSKKQYTKDMNGLDGGVAFFFKCVVNLIPEGEKVSFEEEIFPVLINRKELKAYLTNIRYYDMGTFERLDIIRNVIQ